MMDRYGAYETTGYLYSGDPGVTWFAARAAGSGEGPGDGSVCVSVCAPDVHVVGAAAADRMVRAFLASSLAQRRLTSQTDGRVASVLDVGATSAGAYRVVERMPLRAADLVRARFRPSADALKSLMQGVLEAVAAFEAVGRAHGRIDPQRVLLDPRGSGSGRWRVTLDGPLGDEAAAAAEPDLRQVGRLLYELVVHEPYRVTAGYPLEESSAFARLGRSSSAFLGLTNTLLDPSIGVGSGGPTASAVLEQLARIDTRERGQRAGMFAAIGAVAALLAVGGGVAAWQFTREEQVAPEAQVELSFGKLASLSANAGWLIRLRNRIETDAEFRRLLESDAHLASNVVAPLLAADTNELDPLVIVDTNREVREFTAVPGWVLQNSERFEGQTVTGSRVESAWETMASVRDAIRAWPALERVSGLAATWGGERNWEAVSRLASDLVAPLSADFEAFDPDADNSSVLSSMDGMAAFETGVAGDMAALLASVERLDALEAAYGALVERASAVAAAGAARHGDPEDPLLIGFAQSAERRGNEVVGRIGPGGDPVEAALAALASIREGADVLAAFVLEDPNGWARVERDYFTQESAVLRAFAGGEAPSVSLYRRWRDEAALEKYQAPPAEDDPRLNWTAGETVASLEASLASLRADYPREAAEAIRVASAEHGSFDDRLAAARREIEQLTSGAVPWRSRNVARVERDVARIDGEVRALSQQINEVEAEVRVTWDEFLAAIGGTRSVSAMGLSSIDGAYVRRRDQLISLRDGQGQAVKELREDDKALRSFLESVESSVRVELAPRAVPSGFDESAFTAAFVSELDSAVASVLRVADAEWTGERYEDSRAVRSAVATAREGLADWERSAVSAAAEYASAEALLDGAYLPDERGADGETLLAIVDRWSGFLASEAGVSRALGRVVARADAVTDLWREASVATLIEAARGLDEPLEISRAAYARLDEASGGAWPGTVDELTSDLQAAGRLLASLDGAGVEGRSAALQVSVRQVRQRRVESGLSSLGSRAGMEAGLERVVNSDVDVASLAGWVRFNIAAWRLKAEMEGVEEDGAIRALAGEAAAALGALRDEARARLGGDAVAAASSWLESLAALSEPPQDDGPAFEPGEAGPGRFGWTAEASDDLSRLTYTSPDGSAEMGFAAVEIDPDGGSPRLLFVQTEEVSIGVFNAIVGRDIDRWEEFRGRRMWIEFDKAFQESGGDNDRWDGARSWRWDREASRLVANESWMQRIDEMDAVTPAYPAELGDPNDPKAVSSAQGRPTLDHPMNAVSFEAASLVVDWVGCRLPTADEWLAAYRKYEAGSGPGEWNLRDATVDRQVEHLRAVQAERAPAVSQFASWTPERGSYEQVDDPFERNGEFRGWVAADGSPTDDGRLWFDPVGERGSVLHGMVGNVAELCDDGGNRMRLLGSSAFGDARPPLGVGVAPIEIKGRFRSAGFSDFGFRLVFEAEGALRKSARVLLAELLREAPYLRGGPGAG